MSQKSIPTSKVERAGKFVQTGVKVSGNYVKHFAKKLVGKNNPDELHEDNAEAIYEALSELKGSALKAAQMISMDKNVLPEAYTKIFQLSQYKVSPLSAPLIIKTFKSHIGKAPQDIFDNFNSTATHAASIGQVHEAYKDGKKLAIKIQYPGVADSISSDLRIVKPFAVRMLNMQGQDIEKYFKEIETKLIEETDYGLELQHSQEFAAACKHLKGLVFPAYYPEYSSKRILTMDWIEGKHLKEFLAENPNQTLRNEVGQHLWDFYQFQIHKLKKVQADPHPGNFLFRADGSIGVIDFGCIKYIPQDFYDDYFQLIQSKILQQPKYLKELFFKLEFLLPEDSVQEQEMYTEIFTQMIELLARPFHQSSFDFSDAAYFKEIVTLGESLSKRKELRNSRTARGKADGIYINRTYFGLYNLLHELGATVQIT
jgi:predicted unusual protein kinase regulating ubiquinone biosynthesis (AarF/ABC1/UbiB family)